MIDELELMRARRAARATFGVDLGDTVSLPSDVLGAPLPLPDDAPRVDYVVTAVSRDCIWLATPEIAGKRPAPRPTPPMPPWARKRGRR